MGGKEVCLSEQQIDNVINILNFHNKVMTCKCC